MNEAPGLYLQVGGPAIEGCDETVGAFRAGARGVLARRVEDRQGVAWFEGVVYDPAGGGDDAARALATFRRGGAEAVSELDGSFNLLVVERDGAEAWLVSDAIATRPWYVHSAGPSFAAAPTPLAFSRAGLPMSFDRAAALETIRLGYTQSAHTLVPEIERNRPVTCWRVGADGRASARLVRDLVYRPDLARDREALADRVHAIVRDAVSAVVRHPLLRDRKVHLPLTGGLDSRQILAELLAQGRTPAAFRHVLIQAKDFEPVKLIAARLGVPTVFKGIEDLDFRALFRRWAERSAGLVNFHQSYLLDGCTEVPPAGVLSFDGYAMDFLLSVQTKTNLDASGRAVDTVWNRRYTVDPVLHRLFPDHRTLSLESRALMEQEAANYEGGEWFKMGMMDLFHRSLKYTGSAYCLTGDEALSFAPGAVSRALDFFCTADPAESRDTRARLLLMKRYYPELAALPGKYGTPYSEMDELIELYPSKADYAWWWLRSALTLGRVDAVPEGEHRWLRTIPILRRMHHRVVHESRLASDGLLDPKGLRLSWALLRAGLYEGWTLMSLLTVEVAYRLLSRGESLDDVVAWLCDAR
jgi:hypothetical protein